jgi:hypothetical protein
MELLFKYPTLSSVFYLQSVCAPRATIICSEVVELAFHNARGRSTHLYYTTYIVYRITFPIFSTCPLLIKCTLPFSICLLFCKVLRPWQWQATVTMKTSTSLGFLEEHNWNKEVSWQCGLNCTPSEQQEVMDTTIPCCSPCNVIKSMKSNCKFYLLQSFSLKIW